MSDWEGAQLNKAKEILAFELTKLVHGEEEALKAQESAKALFSSGNAAEMPTVELTDEDLENGTIGINPEWCHPIRKRAVPCSRGVLPLMVKKLLTFMHRLTAGN